MRIDRYRLLTGPLLLLALLPGCGDGGGGTETDRLVFVTAPFTGTWGDTFTVQPTVVVVDGDEEVVDSSTAEVTLTLIEAGGAILTGTTVRTVDSGTVLFAGLAIDRPAVNVRLVASAVGLVSDTSDVITIGGPEADHLAFTVVPDSGRGGEYLGVVPTAEVRTADGRLVPWYGGVATVWIAGSVPEPARAWTNLDGKLVDTTEGGIVTFPGLNIDTAKVGYRLVVEIPGLLPDTTEPFPVYVGKVSNKSIWASFGDPLVVGDSLQVFLSPRDLGGNRVALNPDSLWMLRVGLGDPNGTFGTWEDTGLGSGLPGPYKVIFHATVAGTVQYMVMHGVESGPRMPGSITVGP